MHAVKKNFLFSSNFFSGKWRTLLFQKKEEFFRKVFLSSIKWNLLELWKLRFPSVFKRYQKILRSFFRINVKSRVFWKCCDKFSDILKKVMQTSNFTIQVNSTFCHTETLSWKTFSFFEVTTLVTFLKKNLSWRENFFWQHAQPYV